MEIDSSITAKVLCISIERKRERESDKMKKRIVIGINQIKVVIKIILKKGVQGCYVL